MNEQVLDAVGALNETWKRLSSAWVDDVPPKVYSDARRMVAAKMNGSAAFVLEDPYLCRLWPFWLKVLGESAIRALAIHVLQPPEETSSRPRRPKSAEDRVTLWMRCTVEAEAIPVKRLLVDRNAILADPGSVSVRLRRWLDEQGIGASSDLDHEIDALLHRIRGHRYATLPLDGHIGSLADLTYRALSRGTAAGVRCDRALSATMRRRIQLALDSRTPGTSRDTAQLAADLRTAIVARDLAAASLARQSATLDALAAVNADKDRHVTNLEALVGELKGELAAVHRSRSWRLTAPLRALAAISRAALRRIGVRPLVIGVRPGPKDRGLILDLARSEMPRGVPRGWHRLELRGVESTRVPTPRLFVDSGAGLSPAMLTAPPAKTTSQSTFLLRLRARTTDLRLELFEGPARFGVDAIALTRVSALSVARMFMPQLMAIVRRRPGYSGSRLREVLALWRERGLEAAVDRIVHYDDHDEGSFDQWVTLYDEPTPERRRRYREANAQLPRRPRISILLPVYNTPRRSLRRCLESVLAQTYREWELCIADDASTDWRVRLLLARYALRDRRIKIVRRATNGHIAAATNSALTLATGEFIALLDHDDELAPWAMYWIASSVAETPDAHVVYSDEDKIDDDGRRFDPYFKPDWNPELLRAQNYLCHLTAFRRSAVVDAGGFREGFEGSQDWDLALRVTERCRPEQIRHIPRILYHWRTGAASTARSAILKQYASEAGQRAVAEALERAGLCATVEQTIEGYHRIRYQAPMPHPKASIIIPTRNGLSLVRTCLDSIFRHTDYSPYEILLIDNQSDDPAALNFFRVLAERENVRVLRFDEPFNYSAINNFGAAAAQGDVLVLLNSDTEVIHGDWLQELVALAAQPQNGAVGAMLFYPSGAIQHGGVVVGFGGVAGHIAAREPGDFAGQMSRCRIAQNLTAVTGACLAVRKAVFHEAGGLDACQLPVAFNDIDFCLKVAALGYRNVWTPHVRLIHHESASRGYDDTSEKQARFRHEVRHMIAKWGETLRQDPAYNPNLDLERRGPFALAFPPRVTHESRSRLPSAKDSRVVSS